MIITDIEIDGCIDVNDNPISLDEFNYKFIEWIEENNWHFCGFVK